MIWCEKKADCGEHIDQIRGLPENVIDSILQCLPVIDPRLEFENYIFEKCKHLEAQD